MYADGKNNRKPSHSCLFYVPIFSTLNNKHISDFGMVTVSNSAQSLRTAGKGTFNWCAPERFRSNDDERPRPSVDVYALGMLMYEVATGKVIE
jgi:serine/threonine protein kinase